MSLPVELDEEKQYEAYIVDDTGLDIIKIEDEETLIPGAIVDTQPILVKEEEDEVALAVEVVTEADLCRMLNSLQLDEEVELCRMFNAITLQERSLDAKGFVELAPLPRNAVVADALARDDAMLVDEPEGKGVTEVNEVEVSFAPVIKSEDDDDDVVILSDIHNPHPAVAGSESSVSILSAPSEVKTECVVVVLDVSEEDTLDVYADLSFIQYASVQDIVMGEPATSGPPTPLVELEQDHTPFSPHLREASSECRIKPECADTPGVFTDVEAIDSSMFSFTQRSRDVDPESVVEVKVCIKSELPSVDSLVSYADYVVVIPGDRPKVLEEVEASESEGIEVPSFASPSNDVDTGVGLREITYVSLDECDSSMADGTFETWFDTEMTGLVEKLFLLTFSDVETTLPSTSSFVLLEAFATSTRSPSQHDCQDRSQCGHTPCTSASSDSETPLSSAPHTPEFASNFARTHFPELVYHDMSASPASSLRPAPIPELRLGVEVPADTPEVCIQISLVPPYLLAHPTYEITGSIGVDIFCPIRDDEKQTTFDSHPSDVSSEEGATNVDYETTQSYYTDPFEHVWRYALSLPLFAEVPTYTRSEDRSQLEHVGNERACSLPKWRDNTTLEVDCDFAPPEWEEDPLEDAWNHAWAQDFFDNALNDARDKYDAHPKPQPRHLDPQEFQKDPFEDVWHFARAQAFIELALDKIRTQYDFSPNTNELDDEALRTPSTVNLFSPGPYPEPLVRTVRESFWAHWTRPSDADLASIYKRSDDAPAGLLIFSAEDLSSAPVPSDNLGTASKTAEGRARLRQVVRDSFFEHWEQSLEALEL
ncbi:hypothetical protein C8Q78DRAFT_200049 [Trametes maxima]|nr:hypothetical protein C8Q78DRAFT_200049 [Trametes maxima]